MHDGTSYRVLVTGKETGAANAVSFADTGGLGMADAGAEVMPASDAALTVGGFTVEDIKEIILQQAIYCGVPAANHAFKEAAEVIAEVAKTK